LCKCHLKSYKMFFKFIQYHKKKNCVFIIMCWGIKITSSIYFFKCLQLLQINILSSCKVLLIGIIDCIIFKNVGVNCIDWYLNHNLWQHTHRYFGVYFISLRYLVIGKSDFEIFFSQFGFLNLSVWIYCNIWLSLRFKLECKCWFF